MTENNTDENIDRRILKTKRAMRNAVWALMKEKNLSEITITELCQKAEVNRKTFYIHYNTPFDVFNEGIDLFISEFEKQAEKIPVSENILSSKAVFFLLKPLIDTDREIRSIILSPNSNFLFEKLVEVLTETFCKKMSQAKNYSQITKNKRNIIARLLSGSLVTIYYGYARNPDEMSIEEISEVVSALFKNVIEQVQTEIN